MTHKQVAVIGGGVVGVCTAFFLAQAGHDVVVIERRGNVAEESSFGSAGVIAPNSVAPWASPGMPRKILSCLLKSERPVLLKPTFNNTLWRWVKLWLTECEIKRYRINKMRMKTLASYSQDILQQIRQHYQLEYEQTEGFLHLFRTERDANMLKPCIDLLAEHRIIHRVVDAETARTIEPSLADRSFAGALHLPHDESGNCPLFTKQLKHIAQSIGVQFYFQSHVDSIEKNGNQITIHIDNDSFTADAVVLANGIDSTQLLKQLGIRIPLFPVRGYSATVPIRNPEVAPLSALMDESYKVSITRMGNRIRLSGMADLTSRGVLLPEAALRTLYKVGSDWFPDAANYHKANYWSGIYPMLPDGPPLIGPTPIRNVYVNIGHGNAGWAMAAGSGKIIADLISNEEPEIDIEGLTLARYGVSHII